jgi:hypothetical protein
LGSDARNQDRLRGVKWASFGATENVVGGAKLLKGLVGAWGFEPRTPTVSNLPWANSFRINKH